jgi:hypothetical protein
MTGRAGRSAVPTTRGFNDGGSLEPPFSREHDRLQPTGLLQVQKAHQPFVPL